jgi:hypothetical protein
VGFIKFSFVDFAGSAVFPLKTSARHFKKKGRKASLLSLPSDGIQA